MAAAYQTGSASSPTDLLQKLVTWLVAQGWTQNMSQADGSGWRAHLNKGSHYVNMRSAMNEQIWAGANYTNAYGIGLYLGTGYSGASAWNAQAGGPVGDGQTYTVGVGMQLPSGSIIAYHLFDDGSDNIAVVVERTTPIYTHMGWGPSVNKAGTWTGGAYFYSAWAGYWMGWTAGGAPGTADTTAFCPFTYGDYNQCSSAFIRADVDAFTGKWLSVGAMTNPVHGYTGRRMATPLLGVIGMTTDIPDYEGFRDRQVSTMNTQANLLPLRIYTVRDAGGHSLIGDVPGVYFSNGYGNGFAAGGIYSVGADNYMIFPNLAVAKKA